MRKKSAALVAGLASAATFGPLSSPALAADCYGVTSFDDTYVCIVRVENPDAEIVDGPAVLVPEVCLGQLGCTQEQFVFLPDLLIHAGTVVLFHDGQCYYLENGQTRTVAAASADDCP